MLSSQSTHWFNNSKAVSLPAPILIEIACTTKVGHVLICIKRQKRWYSPSYPITRHEGFGPVAVCTRHHSLSGIRHLKPIHFASYGIRNLLSIATETN